MIPIDFITEWREYAPWVTDDKVEQDLIISRAIVEIFGNDELADSLAWRGGTALHMLYINPPSRYSEDIDLVQVKQEEIGHTIDLLRGVLDPLLGAPRRVSKEGSFTLLYRFQSTSPPDIPMRLKIEINTREHFTELGHVKQPFSVDSRWFQGQAAITTFSIEELLGTKLRALYQRRKGRDLFDLWLADERLNFSSEKVVACFLRYLQESSLFISRAEFEENLLNKIQDPRFLKDITPLLSPAISWAQNSALEMVMKKLVSNLPGKPWQSSPQS